ncbi:ubiquitin-like protein [Oscillatoria sp. CS-180]|uniref:choice-of-anchor Y domain-containing protein n=1 Tax=Oscillatoria sp. CS-180 TaxID=3021720 RepID=UPI00232B0F69|nr:ubiquitin-like protein [Oscillatoria sp. CS-180]MDB9525162.1 ubiquitin-like protein [Oscillatoria sp. CS-180]
MKISTGKTIALAANSNDTINSIKVKIRDQEGIPLEEQTLLFADEILEDERSLADYTIPLASTLRLETIQTVSALNEATASIFINEADADTPGSDAAEFTELYDGGVGNTPLDGLAIVFFNGTDDASYEAFDLDGFSTDADGFFVLGNPGVANVDLTFDPGGTGSLQNGADAIALYRADAIDFPNDTPVTTTGLLDAIIYGTGDVDDAGLLAGLGQSTQFDENANGNQSDESNSRVPDGTGPFQTQAPTPGTANSVTNTANEVPVTADSQIVLTEDTVYTFSSSNFPFADTDSGDTLQVVRITALPSVGQLFIDADGSGTPSGSEAVVQNQEIAIAEIAQLKFVPAADASGADYTSLQFQVSDGTDVSAVATLTIDVTPVNDAPAISGSAVFDPIDEDTVDALNTGTPVLDLVGVSVSDPDISNAQPTGIAVTGADTANGTWQYSTEGDIWQDLGPVSDSNAVLLGPTGLYTALSNSAPDTQNWLSYTAVNLANPFGTAATETVNASGTTLDTTNDQNIYAGYGNYAANPSNPTFVNADFPTLDNTLGYQIAFDMQLLEESGTNPNRAGFSILAVSEDTTKAIELGFQKTSETTGNIFAQSDNPLFTAAEAVAFDTNPATRYTLSVKNDSYQLFANGLPILSGVLRDYTAFSPPQGVPDPYELPNLVFLGDNTTSAQSSFLLSQVAVTTDTRIRFVPNADYSGDSTLTFRAWDTSDRVANGQTVDASVNGGATALSADAIAGTLTVNPINDSPSFTASNPPTVEENSGLVTVENWASFAAGGGVDEATQTATYVISNISDSNLFVVAPSVDTDGNLTYTLAEDISGTSTFEVAVQDSGSGANLSESQTFTITVSEEEVPGFTFTKTTATVSEAGDTDTYRVALTSQPTADVVLTFDGGDELVTPETITFVPNEWGQQQTITVAAIDDSDVEGDHTGTISHSASSNDPNYNGIAIAPITVDISDNDASRERPASLIFTFEQFVRYQVINKGGSLPFSETLYLLANPDVQAAVNQGLIANGFQHFSQFGAVEGRPTLPLDLEVGGLKLAALFDETNYLSQYSDVADAVVQGFFNSGFDHFVQAGLTEGRNPSDYYDEAFYLDHNSDVETAIDDGLFSSGLVHYLTIGHIENRTASELFDPQDYLLNNDGIQAAIANGTFDSAFDHLIEFGAEEGRLPILLFEEAFYLSQNPDVAEAVVKGDFDSGFDHYVSVGQREVRNSSAAFNERAYLEAYPDVAAAVSNGDFSSGMEHFFRAGRAEGRLLG